MTTLPAEGFVTRLIAEINQHIDDLAGEGTTLDQYVELTMLKRRLDAAAGRIKKELEPRMADLLDDFAQRGVSGERHASSGKAVSINTTLRPRLVSGVEKSHAAEILEQAGFAEFVEKGFNLNTLGAYFRDAERQYLEAHGIKPAPEDLVPAELRDVLGLFADTKLGVAS